MKHTSAHTQAVWKSGDYAGDTRRPAVRATIQKLVAPHPQYRIDDSYSRQWAHSGAFTSIMFGQPHQRPRELANIKAIKYSRGVDTDVGECTITLVNVNVRNDLDPVSDSELDFPGYYTPNRGAETYFDQWGYVKNEWKNWLVPDRLIRTYEGYGINPFATPEADQYQYPSGTWLVDDVVLDTAGLITLQCRDVGRVLLEQIMFPPLVPYDAYPLWFSQFEDRGKPTHVADGDWRLPKYETDSNIPYIGSGITDGGKLIVASDGTVGGRHGRDAFDDSTFSFWRSCGKRNRTDSDAYEYLQGKFTSAQSVEGVKVDAAHGPYRVYISLQNTSGDWLGNKRIPYKARNVNTHANIPYVAEFMIAKGETLTVKLPKKYTNIKRVRYTFGHLAWSGVGSKLLFRAAINSVYTAPSVNMVTQSGTHKYGNYGDYTTIVKWLCAWGGFYWPNEESGIATQTQSDGTSLTVAPASDDPALPEGRVWGDFELTGTKGIAKLDVDVFDKKPLMDGVAAVREITGFDFWVDETGGVVWRLPNIWTKGNYFMPEKGGPRASRTSTLIEIDERETLLDMQVKLSSRNVRERIYVANLAGGTGSVVSGYRPDNSGLRRYAGWTDQRFANQDEADRVADLIALKQAFLYRQNTITIAGNPALQPDDQVVVTERMTGEGYIHRILNISSDFDAETGRWTYSLTTNWLGSRAFTKLAWDPKKMTNATRTYLFHMGKLSGVN